MKIIYITPDFQHPRVRGSDRHYHFIRELSQRHDITLLTLVRHELDDQAVREMEGYTTRLYTFDVNGHADSRLSRVLHSTPMIGKRVARIIKMRKGIRQMRQRFKELTAQEEFDVALFHGKSVFQVIKNVDKVPIVNDFCDATSMRVRLRMRYDKWWLKPLIFFRWLQVRRVERGLLKTTAHTAFVSNRDRRAILGEKSRALVLPLGVDSEFWRRRREPGEAPGVIFTGVMDYGPNNDAAMLLVSKILPRLRQEVPELTLKIVGRNPSEELIRVADKLDGVTVTGFVEDLRPYIEASTVYVAPIRYASGSQNKILEAMALEIPVVTTSVVADGLKVDGEGRTPLVVANSVEAFVIEIRRLLADAEERKKLAQLGRQFVLHHYDWSRSAVRLEAMCKMAAEKR